MRPQGNDFGATDQHFFTGGECFSQPSAGNRKRQGALFPEKAGKSGNPAMQGVLSGATGFVPAGLGRGGSIFLMPRGIGENMIESERRRFGGVA